MTEIGEEVIAVPAYTLSQLLSAWEELAASRRPTPYEDERAVAEYLEREIGRIETVDELNQTQLQIAHEGRLGRTHRGSLHLMGCQRFYELEQDAWKSTARGLGWTL